VGEEIQREEIAQEFKTVLQDKIGVAAALSLGAFESKWDRTTTFTLAKTWCGCFERDT
jgi:hypothetical protein